jgi:MFS family permease
MTAKIWGFSASFYLSSSFAVCAFLALLLAPDIDRSESVSQRRGFFTGFREVLSRPVIIAAGVANFFNSMLYSAVMVYFPVYGASIGLDESQVGVGLTVRGMVSTASRIPSSAAVSRVGALKLMTFGIGVSALTVMVFPSFESLLILSSILGVQGIAYGVYLTSGNVYVTEEAPPGLSGAAIGVFSTFSNLSGIISPLILGAASEVIGLRASLRVAAGIALLGMLSTLVFTPKKGSPRTS